MRRSYGQVLKRVSACSKFLISLNLKPRDIEIVLLFPEQFWERVAVYSKNGKNRICFSPNKKLRRIQKKIAGYLKNIPRRRLDNEDIAF